jgi:hypothetical protein
VLLDLAALRWSAEGVRVKYSGGKSAVIDGSFGEPKEIVAGTPGADHSCQIGAVLAHL